MKDVDAVVDVQTTVEVTSVEVSVAETAAAFG